MEIEGQNLIVQSNNVLHAPNIQKKVNNEEYVDTYHHHTQSMLNRSSMMTYSNIICCLCEATIAANTRGMCATCEKSEANITDSITKTISMQYCKGCDRYLRPPWTRCALESPEMMSLCLSKIKGLNKLKLIDSSFVWTEPHSKIIKLKLTVQKEMNKNLLESSVIIEFKVEWTQCDDCKKTFTPHLWNASCQIRQKVSHKRTFMLLEQMILKHKAHTKALSVKEHGEGIDFYFVNKGQAASLSDFIHSVLPIKIKQSKQLVSHDQHSNLYNYKYTFMIEIAPVCKDDLIVLDKETSKELGGIGPILLCNGISSNVHLVDPITFQAYEYDSNCYWKYGFKSFIDRSCLEEYLIIGVDEEIDYKKKYGKQNVSNMVIDEVSNSNSKINQSKSTNYKNNKTVVEKKPFYGNQLNSKDYKVVTVQCILNKKDETTNNAELITAKTHLGKHMKSGDIFYGYDLTHLNMNHELEDIMSKTDYVPDVVLVKKKYVRSEKERIWKLKHLDKDVDVEMSGSKKKNALNQENEAEQYEQFKHDLETDKDLRKNVNLYRDDEAIKELEGQFKTLKVKDTKIVDDEDDVTVKVEELLQDLKIIDDEKTEVTGEVNENKETVLEKEEIVNTNKNDKKINLKKKQIGKRERTGKQVEENDDE